MTSNNNDFVDSIFESDIEDFLAHQVNQSIVPETQPIIVNAQLKLQPPITLKFTGRPKSNKDRKEYAKKYALTNYFRAFERCLMYIYNKLKEDDYDKLNEVTQSNLIDQISSFVEEIQVFLKMLELLLNDPFPNLHDYMEGSIQYSTQLIEEIPSRTISFALRKLKQFKKGVKNPTINEIQLKSIVLGTILLVGVGKIDLSIKEEESTSNRFQRIVNDLLRRSKLMSQVTMTYLVEYWDSIIQLILQEKVQTIDEEESGAREIEDESQVGTQKCQREKNQNSQDMSEKREDIFLCERLDVQNDHQGIICHDDDSFDCFLSDYINGSSSYSEGFYEEISMRQLEKVEQKFETEEKKKKPAKKNIQSQTSLFNSQQNERTILQKRAISLFNYYKKGSRKGPSKKSSQPKKRQYPNHEKRQIDFLIDFILEDEFVIAYAMGNHIYHGLEAEGLTLQA